MSSKYFDFNATTPLSPTAREAWLNASDQHWHNASSLYREAGFTAQKLDAARERLAGLLGCEAQRIVFTSGATEANNALFASLASHRRGGARALISAVEHPSVREAAKGWVGIDNVIELPVDNEGVVDLDRLRELLTGSKPALVSVMAANNESGVLQNWEELIAICRAVGVPFHSDAAQWVGKMPAARLGSCDYLTGSAHKFGGTKGVGFLVLKDEEEVLRFMRGGPQESGRRAGTENYPGIEAMVAALEACPPAGDPALRNAFEATMRTSMPGLRVISQHAPRLWNTSLMVMPCHDNLKWLTRLSRLGFAISTGSACSSGKEGSSVVVRALGASEAELKRVVRVSSSWTTTAEDWLSLAQAFQKVGEDLDAGRRPG